MTEPVQAIAAAAQGEVIYGDALTTHALLAGFHASDILTRVVDAASLQARVSTRLAALEGFLIALRRETASAWQLAAGNCAGEAFASWTGGRALIDISLAKNGAARDMGRRSTGGSSGGRAHAAANLRAALGATGDVPTRAAVAVGCAQAFQAADAGVPAAIEQLVTAGILAGAARRLQGIAARANDLVALISRAAATCAAAQFDASIAASARIGRTGLIVVTADASTVTAELVIGTDDRLALAGNAFGGTGPVRRGRAIGRLAAAAGRKVGAVIVVGSSAAAGRAVQAADILAGIATGAEALEGAAEIGADRPAIADGIAAAIEQAAVLVDLAAGWSIGTGADLVGGRQAPRPGVRRAAELFAVAGAVAAGLVAAFGMGRPDRGRIAAIGAAFLGAGRGRDLTDALAVDVGLLTGAAREFGGGGRTASRLGVGLQNGAADRGGATEAEEPLEHGATACAVGKRLDQRIEPTVVHSLNLPSPFGEVSCVRGRPAASPNRRNALTLRF